MTSPSVSPKEALKSLQAELKMIAQDLEKLENETRRELEEERAKELQKKLEVA